MSARELLDIEITGRLQYDYLMEPQHFEALYPENSRSREIEQILAFIKAGNSVQLIGLPGAGRSNLLGLLSYNHNVRVKNFGENQKWFHFVYANFAEIRRKPLLELEKYLFLCLLDSLKERKKPEEYNKLNEIFKESLSLNDELVMFSGLKKAIDYLAIEKELTLVFLFDRFEEYIPVLTSDFFSNLRILRNRAKYRFSVVFSLNRPLEDLIEPMMMADFYEFISEHLVYLDLMDKPGLDFRIAYLEKALGKKINEKLVIEIIKLTAGHGKLTRICLETATASSVKRLASNLDLEKYLLEQKTVRGCLYEIWHALLPEEQQLISDLSNHPNLPYLPFLERVGLIKNNKITIPLFKAFVDQLNQNSSETSEVIIFDQNTNEIKKGHAVISNQLTSLEFKLLRFFIENKEKILEREEIISGVWKETASVAGVTDQALDQLIFRLRKKIEANPNQPKHLETIKGRGFKFTV